MEPKKAEKLNLENRRTLHLGIGLVVSFSLTITAFEWRTEVGSVVNLDTYEYTFCFPQHPIQKNINPEFEPPPTIWNDNGSVATNALQYKSDPNELDQDSVSTTYCGFPLDNSNEIYTIAEEMPSYEGGFDKLFKALEKNIEYPKAAQRMNVEGRVFVQFIVSKDGTLSDLKVIKGIGAGCDEEAIRVMSLIPSFVPGKQGDVRVPVKMVIPINFKLQ